MPLNTRWALPENSYAISDSGTRVLLFDDAFTDQALALRPDLKILLATGYAKGVEPRDAASAEDPWHWPDSFG